MKTNKSKKVVQMLAVGAAALLGAAEARATNYTIGGTVGTDLEGGWNLSIDGNSDSGVLVGDIKLIPSVGPTINTVCTDVSGTVFLGSAYNYVTKAFAASPSSGIDPSWGSVNTPAYLSSHSVDAASANQGIQNAAHVFALYGSYLTAGTLSQKAAVQIAVWAALYDSGNGTDWATDLAGGSARFHASNSGDAAAVTQAVTWLTSAVGSDGTAAHTQYSGNLLTPDPLVQHGNTAQEMLLTPTPVPEPTTVLAGMLLLLPFGASAIRHVRKQKTA